MKDIGRQIISQSHAARLRGVARQRINELVSKDRFTTPTDDSGAEIKGSVYLDEVLNLVAGERGRPRRNSVKDNWFKKGDTVIWNLIPRGGYGFTIPIIAAVIKISAKKIQLHFTGGDNSEYFAWANRDDCKIFESGASDNGAEEKHITSLEAYDIITEIAQKIIP